MNPETQDVVAALNAGAALADPCETSDGMPYVVIPEGYTLRTLESQLLAPHRKRGVMELHDVASFIAVVNEQKNESTHLFATEEPPCFTAVFNDTAVEPGWGDHRAIYRAPLSREWRTWTGANGRQMDQTAFAQFIEQNLPDIADPDGATVLEVSRSLEAKKKVNFASGLRLSDGSVQFTYEEDVQGTAQKGRMKVPEIFVLAIPVVKGGDPWRVEARLRYRIAEGGRLTIWYELVREHKVVEQVVKEVAEQVAAKTGLVVLAGVPAAHK